MFFMRRFHQNLSIQTLSQFPLAPFNYKNAEHQLLIQAKLSVFKSIAFRLKANDQNLMLGFFVVGVGCTAFLSLLSLVFVAVMIDAIATVRASILERPLLYEAYKKALNELIEIYHWTMPEGHSHWDTLGLDSVQDLILTLGPLVSVKTIHRWQASDLEPVKQLFAAEDNIIKSGLSTASATLGFTSRKEPSDAFKARLNELSLGRHLRSIDYIFYGQNSEKNPLNGLVRSFQPEVNKAMREAGSQLVTQVASASLELGK